MTDGQTALAAPAPSTARSFWDIRTLPTAEQRVLALKQHFWAFIGLILLVSAVLSPPFGVWMYRNLERRQAREKRYRVQMKRAEELRLWHRRGTTHMAG